MGKNFKYLARTVGMTVSGPVVCLISGTLESLLLGFTFNLNDCYVYH